MLAAPRHHKESRPERRRDVTIIAGFPITGFVVLAADGEEGDDYEKASVSKIARIDENDYKCLVGGSGDGDWIDLAVQEASDALKGLKSVPTQQIVRLTLEAAVTNIYLQRIDTLPQWEQQQAGFDLLCAIWTRESSRVDLVKVGRARSLVRLRPEVIGKGSYLARYLIQMLYSESETLAVRHIERMCAYILARVKAHVKDCGGSSQIVRMGPDGRIYDVPQVVIDEDEQSTAVLMNRAMRLLFHWTDPIGWQGNEQKLAEVIDSAAQMLKTDLRIHIRRLQETWLANRAIQPAPEDPTRDRKGPPASQE